MLLALSCRREGVRYIKQPAWWLANVAIGVAYIPGCWCCSICWRISPSCGSAATSVDPQVSWGDLPAMYWRFLTGHDGSNYPTVILWLLPAMFIALCSLLLWRRETPRTFSLLLLGGILIPVTLVFAISRRSPLFVDRYLYSAALGIPLVLGVLIAGTKSRVRGISLLLFFSLLFGCGVRNDYPVEKDEFSDGALHQQSLSA